MKGYIMRLHEFTDHNINGVIIKTSKRTNTGFDGVTFSVTWRPTAPFVASAKNDEELFAATGTKSNTVHIGYFSDSREAAYARSVFENSPTDEKIDMLHNGVDLAYPADLYKLPEKITHEEAEQEIIAYRKANQVDDPIVPVSALKQKVQQELANFYKDNAADYKVEKNDATAIREAMTDYLKTITKPRNSDVIEAARLAFEPYKKG